MSEGKLDGARVMVVEDEYLLADDLCFALASLGAVVVGPFPSIRDATASIDDDVAIDLAVLDVNLRGDMVFPVADALMHRGIPFAFATGYDRWTMPTRFAEMPWVEKPFKSDNIAAVLAPLLVRQT